MYQTFSHLLYNRLCGDTFGFGLLATIGAVFPFELERAIFTDHHCFHFWLRRFTPTVKLFEKFLFQRLKYKRMKRSFTCLLFLVFLLPLKSQSLYFPPNNNTVWDTISPQSLGYCQNEIDSLYELLDLANSKAFLLLKDGKIVLEKYFDGFTKDSIWYWASAGKTMTAMLTGIAQQEGHLTLSDTTSEYLGDGWTNCTPAQEEKITIRHQLTMTSGLDDGVPDPYCTLDSCLIYKADAGTRWAYHNGPYTLLDGVIEAATGQNLNAYYISKIRNPIGMNGFFLPSGYNNVLFTNPRSIARFGLLVLNKGNWNGTPILKDTAYFNQMVNTSQLLNRSYGYLWWLNGKASYRVPGLQFQFPGPLFPDAPDDMIAALGKNGQFISIAPSQNLLFIRMGDSPGAGEVPYILCNEIWQKINRLTCLPTAAEEAENTGDEIMVYPNPASTSFRIELKNSAADFEVSIGDLTGRQLGFYKNQHAVNVGNMAPGVYYLTVQVGRNRIVKKLIIAP